MADSEIQYTVLSREDVSNYHLLVKEDEETIVNSSVQDEMVDETTIQDTEDIIAMVEEVNYLFVNEDVQAIVNSSFQDKTEHESTIQGTFNSREEIDAFLGNLKALGYEFAVRSSRKFEWDSKGNNRLRFRWTFNNAVIEKKYPFRIASERAMQCSMGGAYRAFGATRKTLADTGPPVKKRSRVQLSRKQGCPSVFTIKEIEAFPDYECLPRKRAQHRVIQKLREDIIKKSTVKRCPQYFVCISKYHNHLPSATHLRVHPLIGKEISLLAESGMTSVKEARLHLESFAQKHFEMSDIKPDPLNSGFFPSVKVIRNRLCQAIFKRKKSKLDQEALEKAIEEWKKGTTDQFFFRPFVDYQESGSQQDPKALLFCHQTAWQKDIMKKYGDSIFLLDAAHKTTKYSLPLFFVVVKTNVMYQIIGTFVVQVESGDSISEALTILKTWNPSWEPKCWMMDYSEMENNVIEKVFPDSRVYLCRFHLEEAWQLWLKKNENFTENSEALLNLFRDIADSTSDSELETALRNLTESEICKKFPKVLKYFNNTWMSEKSRWIELYNDRDYASNMRTISDLKAKNKDLKYSILEHSANRTLTGMLKVVLHEHLPRLVSSYQMKNLKMNGNIQQYDESIPKYLRNRPHDYINHVVSRLAAAETEYTEASIFQVTEGVFEVKSIRQQGNFHTVDVHTVHFSFPSCSCLDFRRHMHPCKHFAAVFLYIPGWSFDSLPEAYRNNSLINMDANAQRSLLALLDQGPTVDEQSAMDEATDYQEIDSPEATMHETEENSEPSEVSIDICQEKLRELLKDTLDMSYLCTDVKGIEDAIVQVQRVQANLKKYVQL